MHPARRFAQLVAAYHADMAGGMSPWADWSCSAFHLPTQPRSRVVKQTLSERCRVGRWSRMAFALRQTLYLSV